MAKNTQLRSSFVWLIAALFLAQCGVQFGSQGSGVDDLKVEITPSVQTLRTGEMIQIRARQTYVETDAAGRPVTVAETDPELFVWEMEGDSAGATLRLGKNCRCMEFRAPRQKATIRVVATSQRNSNAYARASLFIEE